MDVSRFMPNFRSARDSELLQEQIDKTVSKGVKTQGPVRYRTVTPGQQRRAMVRASDTAARKSTKAFRRRWMANQRAIAALRGQLQVVGQIPWSDGEVEARGNHQPIAVHLTAAYGSVDEARSRYFEILMEQARANKTRQVEALA